MTKLRITVSSKALVFSPRRDRSGVISKRPQVASQSDAPKWRPKHKLPNGQVKWGLGRSLCFRRSQQTVRHQCCRAARAGVSRLRGPLAET